MVHANLPRLPENALSCTSKFVNESSHGASDLILHVIEAKSQQIEAKHSSKTLTTATERNDR